MKLLAFFIIVMPAFLTFAQATNTHIKSLTVSEGFASTNASAYSRYFEDISGELTVDEVLQLPPEQWKSIDSASPNFGASSSHFWFKLSLHNQSGDAQNLVLLNNYAPTDALSFYHLLPSFELKADYHTGDSLVHSSRPITHFSYAFPVHIKSQEKALILLKVSSKGSVIVPLSMWEQDTFYAYKGSFFLIFGLLVGVLLITSIYNCFVYLKTKEKLFLTFSFFILSIAFLVVHQSGMAMQYFWPNSPVFNQFAAVLSIALASVGHCVFSLTYLHIKGRLKALCLGLLSISLALVALYPLISYNFLIQAALLNGALVLLITLVFAVYRTYTGDKNAQIYALAWSPFILGVIISASIRFNAVPYSVYTEFAGLFFAVVTIVWLSMAIAERINREKQKRISAQKEAISNLKRYEDLFENSVEGIFSSTLCGKLISVNAAFIKMLDFSDKQSLFDYVRNDLANIYKRGSDREQLIKKVRAHKRVVDEEVELIKRDGTVFWASLTLRLTMNDESKTPVIEGAMIDITDRKMSERQLAYLASHDPLTDLYNRREFEGRLNIALKDFQAKNDHDAFCCVLYMDLDQFKIVNDTCGHSVGDRLLKDVTKLMEKTLNARGFLARLGGDEFGVILHNMTAVDAYDIASEILSAVGEFKFKHSKRIFNLGISIGLVELTKGSTTVEDIMSFADTACYTAKDAGRNRIHVYSSDNYEFAKRRREIELISAINAALAADGFTLCRQKIVHNDADFSLYGWEILLRMKDEDGVDISPSEFIPAAERFGLMLKIDKWVVLNTFNWLSNSPDELAAMETCSINLSGQSIGSADLTQHLKRCFSLFGIPHNKVCFEITETHAIEDIDRTIEFITLFQSLGCKFSLDDFGSGLSSYGYLKALPINNVKIDGRFVQGIAFDPADFAMVESIHAVAKAMGKRTIAEYVENEDIVKQLRGIGIHYLQGYAIHKPEAIDTPPTCLLLDDANEAGR
ncbi:EAL domain-containing protein [Glaciecola siphonariae]|uniref:EAL domain-containing protein n=1 Tax=Glaciecola siphonariae TaxID=521012 RepID=A0ABV9LWW3_9ALTE